MNMTKNIIFLKVSSYDKQLDMCKFAGILPFKSVPVSVEFGDEKLNESKISFILLLSCQNRLFCWDDFFELWLRIVP